MFEGSEHHDSGYFQPLQQAGGLLNGSTNPDRTNYWEVVPTGALELALWMESDRMGYLLPALTKEKFENQRDVVLNERRQNYENRPYGLAGIALAAALFPPDHPYHWLTIGSADDLRAMSLDEVREFFATYYHPGQRVARARRRHRRRRARSSWPSSTSARFPPGPRPAPVAARRRRCRRRAARAGGSRRAAAALSRLAFAGDVRRATTRSSISRPICSRTARRRASIKSLVYEQQIATDVVAYQHSREMSGVFQIATTAAPGVAARRPRTPSIVADAARARRQRPDRDELERARAQTDAQFIYRLQTIGGFGGKSDQLNAYNVFRGDPGYFAARPRRYERATPAVDRGGACGAGSSIARTSR